MNTIDSASNFMNNMTSTYTAVISPNVLNSASGSSLLSNGNVYNDKSELAQSVDLRNEVQFRPLCQVDIQELKTLCADWFPVDYPESWYNDITTSKRFYSVAAVLQQKIIGMIVAEIKTKQLTDREDWHILSDRHSHDTQITYILSLGVNKEFRRLGIASMFLDNLLDFLNSKNDCKAIYLHVLCSNKVAINFYEKRDFEQRIYLPNYYTINGQLHDGFCYVLYMNNGQPPWTIIDLIRDSWLLTKKYNPCQLTVRLMLYFSDLFRAKILNRNYLSKDFSRIS